MVRTQPAILDMRSRLDSLFINNFSLTKISDRRCELFFRRRCLPIGLTLRHMAATHYPWTVLDISAPILLSLMTKNVTF